MVHRVDLRVDKRAIYRGWMLDFYIDLLNAALLPRKSRPANIRYVLPTRACAPVSREKHHDILQLILSP